MYIELKTERLLLRPLDISDMDTVHEYASDPENTRFMMFLPKRTRLETEEFLCGVTEEWRKAAPAFYEFAVTLDGRQIGAVCVYLNDRRDEGEIGWILHKSYWRKGYATEAARAVRDFAFEVLGVDSIVAHCDERNLGSYGVMLAIGMTPEDDTGTREYRDSTETAKELCCRVYADI